MLEIEAWLNVEAADEARALLEASGATDCRVAPAPEAHNSRTQQVVAQIATAHAAVLLPLLGELVARADGLAFVSQGA